MSRDIEETRLVRQKMLEMDELVSEIEDILIGQPAFLAVGALTSALGRVMHQTNTPVDYIANGLNLIVDLCKEQDKREKKGSNGTDPRS